MLEAHHFSAAAKRKGSYALPEEFDGTVNRAALYHAVRAFRNNRRQGTHSTKTKGEVSGGNRKPWRQKGTGRARQGSIRAPHWVGGGVVFGPRPRGYGTALPRKVKRLARQSALNARAGEGSLYVIEGLEFDGPKTKHMVELLHNLELGGRKVLLLTAVTRPEVYLSGRNLPNVAVMRFADAAAYDVLWSDAVVVEETAIGGHALKKSAVKSTARRSKRATDSAAESTKKKGAGRALSKRKTTAKKTKTTKTTKAKKTAKAGSPSRKKGKS